MKTRVQSWMSRVVSGARKIVFYDRSPRVGVSVSESISKLSFRRDPTTDYARLIRYRARFPTEFIMSESTTRARVSPEHAAFNVFTSNDLAADAADVINTRPARR